MHQKKKKKPKWYLRILDPILFIFLIMTLPFFEKWPQLLSQKHKIE